jgi:hypothetical protein
MSWTAHFGSTYTKNGSVYLEKKLFESQEVGFRRRTWAVDEDILLALWVACIMRRLAKVDWRKVSNAWDPQQML